MLEADSGGGGGTDITVHTGRLRDVAKQYADLTEKAQSAVKGVTSTGLDVQNSIHHGTVVSAVEHAVTALQSRVGLVAMAFGHCDDGLTTCAEDYDKTDESIAQRSEKIRSEWTAAS